MEDTKKLMRIAEDVMNANQALEEAQNDNFKQLAEQISSINLGDDITKPILALLSLDDKSFAVIAPLVLLDINKSFHDSNNQLLMLQTFNASGLMIEDLQSEIDGLIAIVDNDEMELSQPKKDFLKQIFMDLYNSVSEIKGIPTSIIKVPIELINENAKVPCYAHATDAGLDIYALEDITIAPGETKLIPTGLKVAIPVGYELQVRPKSGRCLKTKLRVANAPGTIDSGYRDEIGVIIDNIESPIQKIYMNDNGTIAAIDYGKAYTIGAGEKFAQLVLAQIKHCAFEEVDSVSEIANDGRNGGFGSSGLK